jgi:hypothetical protein
MLFRPETAEQACGAVTSDAKHRTKSSNAVAGVVTAELPDPALQDAVVEREDPEAHDRGIAQACRLQILDRPAARPLRVGRARSLQAPCEGRRG